MLAASLILKQLCGDGSAKCIYKCKFERCQLKNIFSSQDWFVSTVCKKAFECFTPSGNIYLDCHSLNVIYMII